MTEDASPPRASIRLGPLTHALLLVFTLATALAINPYYYGVADNRITIPFVKAFAHPALYPGDLLIGQGRYYYTFVWSALGVVHQRLHLDLPVLYFGAYLIALYATFLGFYLVALALFRNQAGAVLALLLLAFSRLTLGGIPTVDQMLTTRAVAVPILLFSIHAFLEGRTLRSFALLGLAYLAHPLTTHYVMAMLAVASLVTFRSLGLRRLATGVLAFVAVASPMLIWRLQHSPASLHLFTADPDWLRALRIRSAVHMFPSTGGFGALAHAVTTAALFVITGRATAAADARRHTIVRWSGWTVLALCVAALVFTEYHPIGLAFVLQPLRSFVFLEYFTMILVAHYFVVPSARPRPVSDVVVTVLAGVWIGHESDTVYRPALQYAVLVAAIAIYKYGGLDTLHVRRFATAAAALVCLAAGATFALDRVNGFGPMFSVSSVESPLWLDLQHWASTHTRVRDAFIVPPEQDGEFRVEGERTVYADWVEGGLMNANPEFGREWLRRMEMLGYRDPESGESVFCKLRVSRLTEIAAELDMVGREVFLIWPCLVRPLDFPVRYRNQGYIVYEIPRARLTVR